MPPRRSARASLPTPAASVKTESESTASTPARAPPAKRARGGKNKVPITPSSLTDADDQDVKSEDQEYLGNGTDMLLDNESVKLERDVKRKAAPSETDAPFSNSPAPSATSTSRRYQLDAVVIPRPRRSKLSTEKTTSIDNLTLDSPKGMVDTDIVPAPQTEPGRSAKATTTLQRRIANATSHQPFKIGKHSTVRKENVKSLALDSEDELEYDEDDDEILETKTKIKVKAVQGKGKGRAANALTPPASDVDLSEGGPGDDFAMNSEDEDRQVKKALKASQASALGKQPKKVAGSTKRNNSAALRAAVSKAGGSRAKAIKGDATPLSLDHDSESDSDAKSHHIPSGSDFGASVFSAMSEPSDSEAGSKSLEEEDEKVRSRKGNGKGKGKAPVNIKGKGKSKAKAEPSVKKEASAPVKPKRKLPSPTTGMSDSDISFNASDSDSLGFSDSSEDARRLSKAKGKFGLDKRAGNGKDMKVKEEPESESDGIDESALAGLDPDMRVIAIRRHQARRDRRKHELAMAPIRQQERKMRQRLGRKLTNGERNIIRLEHHHEELVNVWGNLNEGVIPVKPVPMEAHPSLKLTLLPFQKESLYWMKKQEEGPWKGGMLADEMGMGKTIQTIALLLSEPRRKPSLVVAPVVALMQWKHEIETHAEGFQVTLWHGQGRMKAEQLKKFDVVLVSYGTLEASFRRQQRGFVRNKVMIKEKSPMHAINWHRVILDEAHNIKERSTNAAKAAFALQASYKWCLSGTPLQNRVGELYSLVRFLGAEPFSNYFCKKCDCKTLHWMFSDKRHCDECGHKPMDHVCFWNTEILTPIAKYGIEQGGPGHTAFKKLKILLDRMMLRRTKLERADDLGLPPRTIVVRRDFFSPQEKELYMSLFTNAKRTFATYVDQGTVLNNYSNIFSLITRMRQMACHPDLVLRSKTSTLVKDHAENAVCRLCNDMAEDAIVSQCKHLFDRECIRQYLDAQQARGHKPECPVCHIEISINLEAEAVDMEARAPKNARQGILSRLNLDKWSSSSKLEALVEELEKLRNKDCTIKSLVFSQFVSFLDLIAFRLQRAGFVICRLEGGMTPQQRDATIQHFMNNTHVTVFLISLKAGGVALNLTEASMVFMMDSWWNPSVEYQAMDRIHRLGQKRPVKVVKLVIEDSIEDQIVQLQHKKLAMTEAALSTDPDAALGKLTVEDLGFLFKM